MTELVLSFLKELEQNNTREWFHANKGWYDEAKLEVEKLVNTLIPGVARFDPSVKFITAKECMFRIFRDIRFSKDKAPYKNNFGAWITKTGRKSCGPGYYIHIQPGESFLAAGVYMPDPEKLKKIRQEIFYNMDEFKAILEGKELKRYAKGLDEMDKLKKPPKEFPADFPDIEILKNKHFTVSCYLSEKQLSAPTFPEFAWKVFEAMHPFNAFLGRAIDG
ncbi:MAG: DUF2461 domain-containing protein [Bacteroidales bacterium]|nr:DUF2461 domain-containing protein [Bacteroidales bacterium]